MLLIFNVPDRQEPVKQKHSSYIKSILIVLRFSGSYVNKYRVKITGVI
jgi:hypothetical protein